MNNEKAGFSIFYFNIIFCIFQYLIKVTTVFQLNLPKFVISASHWMKMGQYELNFKIWPIELFVQMPFGFTSIFRITDYYECLLTNTFVINFHKPSFLRKPNKNWVLGSLSAIRCLLEIEVRWRINTHFLWLNKLHDVGQGNLKNIYSRDPGILKQLILMRTFLILLSHKLQDSCPVRPW